MLNVGHDFFQFIPPAAITQDCNSDTELVIKSMHLLLQDYLEYELFSEQWCGNKCQNGGKYFW